MDVPMMSPCPLGAMGCPLSVPTMSPMSHGCHGVALGCPYGRCVLWVPYGAPLLCPPPTMPPCPPPPSMEARLAAALGTAVGAVGGPERSPPLLQLGLTALRCGGRRLRHLRVWGGGPQNGGVFGWGGGGDMRWDMGG